MGCLRGALAPLYKILPPSPPGEGGQGDGVNAIEKQNMIIGVTNLSELAPFLPLGLKPAPSSAIIRGNAWGFLARRRYCSKVIAVVS